MAEEENKTIEVAPEVIAKVDEEITQAVAKEEETTKSLGDIKAELNAIKEQNNKLAEAQELVRITAELEAERKRQQELQQAAVRKAVVPPTNNPTQSQEVAAPVEVPKSTVEQWSDFHSAVTAGKFHASSSEAKR